MAITSWSHSKLGDFEKCRFLAWLKHDQKIPEPERPLPAGKTEHANDRGTRIHTAAELFVNGKAKTQIPEMKKFAAEFEHLRHLYTKGLVSLEGEWAVDEAWEPTDWRTGWHRSKVDAIVLPTDDQAIVIDYKSGKRYGNEVKHAEQTQLYALNAVLRYPKLEVVTTELWYLDVDELTHATFTRSQILRFKANFDRRGRALTTCTEFPPNPNVYSCAYCQYGPWNGGQCQVGVRREKK
jgi:CRISPR/Cas system-associated exonuclease Cas4 (RecB family)